MIATVALVVSAVLVMLLLTELSNVLFFPRLGATRFKHEQVSQPKISILIPARNEAVVIAATVRAILDQQITQQGADLELLVLDDHSTDATAALAQQAAQGDPRLRVISGADLPQGWLGKNWACHQLAQAAQGEWLIFVDADVRWQPTALQSLITLMTATRADLLTVWPTQDLITPAERMVVPLMTMVIMSYLPILMVHYSPFKAFAAANGQCLCFRRRAYQQVGGHTAVSANIVEDVGLARLIKGQSLRLRMADGNGLIRCRMYQDWASVRDGFAKNILAGHGNSTALLAFSTVVHWLLFIFPLVWLLLSWVAPLPDQGVPLWPALLVLAGALLRGISAWFTHQRMLDVLTLPIGVLLMTRIAAQALWWRWRQGGPVWKGRIITGS